MSCARSCVGRVDIFMMGDFAICFILLEDIFYCMK